MLDVNHSNGLQNAGISFSENSTDAPLKVIFNPSMATSEFTYGKYKINFWASLCLILVSIKILILKFGNR